MKNLFVVFLSVAALGCNLKLEKSSDGKTRQTVINNPTTPSPVPPPTAPPTTPSATNAEQALASARIWNSPADIASWPQTTRIEKIVMRPNDPNAGLEFFFSTRHSWPNYTPPGWQGPLNYTVWACIKKAQWHCSGVIQFWSARVATGAPILSHFSTDWVYDTRWGEMAFYRPRVGEEMVFFVSAGDARGNGGVTSRRERSNAVVLKLPAGDNGTFTFNPSLQMMEMVGQAEPSFEQDSEHNRKMLEEVERHKNDR